MHRLTPGLRRRPVSTHRPPPAIGRMAEPRATRRADSVLAAETGPHRTFRAPSKHAAGRPVRHRTVSRGTTSLAGLVQKRTKLYRTYKGKEYTVSLSPKGFIALPGKRYKSPTAAAKAVVRRRSAINGRAFWYIKDASGEWVRLLDY